MHQLWEKCILKKRKSFLKRAEEVGLDRVIGGVHHPSDVEAGKKLGKFLGQQMINSK